MACPIDVSSVFFLWYWLITNRVNVLVVGVEAFVEVPEVGMVPEVGTVSVHLCSVKSLDANAL